MYSAGQAAEGYDWIALPGLGPDKTTWDINYGISIE